MDTLPPQMFDYGNARAISNPEELKNSFDGLTGDKAWSDEKAEYYGSEGNLIVLDE